MKEKFISSIMAGVYIALGAMSYLVIENSLVGATFFATGIFLVFNFYGRLFTRVCPMSIVTKEYGVADYIIAWVGNGIGAFLVATIGHFSRFEGKIAEKLQHVAELKLYDGSLSLFIMGFFCAVFVTYAVLLGKKYKAGSFAQIFFVWILITVFVYGGYDHIVANMYYLSAYSWKFGLDLPAVLHNFFFVTLGNIVGGLTIGYLERKNFLGQQ